MRTRSIEMMDDDGHGYRLLLSCESGEVWVTSILNILNFRSLGYLYTIPEFGGISGP
jgi:hypothetical protein